MGRRRRYAAAPACRRRAARGARRPLSRGSAVRALAESLRPPPCVGSSRGRSVPSRSGATSGGNPRTPARARAAPGRGPRGRRSGAARARCRAGRLPPARATASVPAHAAGRGRYCSTPARRRRAGDTPPSATGPPSRKCDRIEQGSPSLATKPVPRPESVAWIRMNGILAPLVLCLAACGLACGQLPPPRSRPPETLQAPPTPGTLPPAANPADQRELRLTLPASTYVRLPIVSTPTELAVRQLGPEGQQLGEAPLARGG